MNLFYSNKKNTGLLLIACAFIISAVGTYFLPSRVAAAGESYVLSFSKGKPVITVSGGDFKSTAKLVYSGQQTVGGILEDVSKGTVTYKTGCTFSYSIAESPLDYSQGTVLDASGGTCPASVTQQYKSLTGIPLQGSSAKSGAIFIQDGAADASNAPAKETFTLKSADGNHTYATKTVSQDPIRNQSIPGVYYSTEFTNPNGLKAYKLQACSEVLDICKTYSKLAGVTLNIDLGVVCKSGEVAGSTGVCAVPASSSSSNDPLDCGAGALSWIVCSVIQGAQSAANTLDSFITSQLNVDASGIFEKTTVANSSSNGYYTAWNSFRIIASALLIIAGLVMVVSQALGFEALDAYTVRKTLPRLLVAIIGISLSWPLMDFVVTFFDTLGHDIGNLIYTPFNHLAGNISVQAGLSTILLAGAAVLVLGFASLTFILTGLLAMFVAFLTLVIRQVAIIILVILAPIGIACYVLPGTQKVWQLWRENFLGLLMMFPIIIAFIAAGHVFSAVSLNHGAGDSPASTVTQLIGILGYFIPYFLLPMAFRMATGAVANIAGMVNDAHKGAFDRLKGVRSNAAQNNWGKFKRGERFDRDNILARGINRAGMNVGSGIDGHFGIGARGRSGRAAIGRAAAAEAAAKDQDLIALSQNSDEGIAIMALSGGTHAGARQAAESLRQSWIAGGMDENEATDRMNRGLNDALSIKGGISRTRAQAGMQLMMQNKARALAGGEAGQTLLAEGLNRLHGNNITARQEAMNTARYFAREGGRADLGDASVGRGTQRTGAYKTVRGHTTAVREAMQDVHTRFTQALAAGDIETATSVAAEATSMRNALGQDVSDDNKALVHAGLEAMGIDTLADQSTSQQFGTIIGQGLSGRRALNDAEQKRVTNDIQNRAGLFERDDDPRYRQQGPQENP